MSTRLLVWGTHRLARRSCFSLLLVFMPQLNGGQTLVFWFTISFLEQWVILVWSLSWERLHWKWSHLADSEILEHLRPLGCASVSPIPLSLGWFFSDSMRVRTDKFTSTVVNYCNSYHLSLCLQLSCNNSYTFLQEIILNLVEDKRGL